jgi:hypothetical protein
MHLTTEMTPSARHGETDVEHALWLAAEPFRGAMPGPEFRELVLGVVLLKHICNTFKSHRACLDAAFRDPSSRQYFSTERERQLALTLARTYRDANGFFVPLHATWPRLEAAAADRPDRLGNLLDAAMAAVERENPELEGVFPRRCGVASLEARSFASLVRTVAALCDRHGRLGPMALAQLARNRASALRAGGREARTEAEPQRPSVHARASEVIADFDEKLSRFSAALAEVREQLRQRRAAAHHH